MAFGFASRERYVATYVLNEDANVALAAESVDMAVDVKWSGEFAE